MEDFIDFLLTPRARPQRCGSPPGDAFAKLDALNQPALSPEETQSEIDVARAERLAPHADRR